ncbi:MAG: FadR family transcriptional regulator [Thermoplasmatales archaeon]|jgi:GntR family transcriptional repressor for pyruvate dehydrogenase complex|nr:FadR family transcriptional regulator [Thermoplasmatales archaeon]
MRTSGASQKVYDYVYEGIKTGTWQPGDKIPSEHELSANLQVSRVSVRKALDQLVGIGLLLKRQGSGAYVTQIATLDALDAMMPVIQMNDMEVIKLLEYRIGFETTNVELLQANITQQLIEQLEKCLEMMRLYRNDQERFYIHDYQFHQIIAEGTGNPFVIRISQLLTEMLKNHFLKLNLKIGPEIGLEYHEKIIEAIKENDFIIAAHYMKRHMLVTIEAVKNAQVAETTIIQSNSTSQSKK